MIFLMHTRAIPLLFRIVPQEKFWRMEWSHRSHLYLWIFHHHHIPPPVWFFPHYAKKPTNHTASNLRGFTSSSSKSTSNLTFSNSVLSHWHQKSPLQTRCLRRIELLQCSQYQAFKFSFISFSERLSWTQVIQFPIEPLVGYFWSAEITFQRPWPFAINCFSQGLLIAHSVQCDGFCCFFGIDVFS